MASSLMPTDRLSTVDEHVERIVESLQPLPPYDQPLLEAVGLPVCEDIAAPMDLPSFDNSAMDGYAVYFDDVVTASTRPVVPRSSISTSPTTLTSAPKTQSPCTTSRPAPRIEGTPEGKRASNSPTSL